MPDFRTLEPAGTRARPPADPFTIWQPIGPGYTCQACGTTTAATYWLALRGTAGGVTPIAGTPWALRRDRTTWSEHRVLCADCRQPAPAPPVADTRKRTLD